VAEPTGGMKVQKSRTACSLRISIGHGHGARLL
jgi:hypothetical protein